MNYLFIYFKGALMGVADLVPGISGGTIALVTGIYQRLINAIASININTLKLFFSGRFKHCWQQIDGWFLLSVFAGILSSIFLLASLIKYLLVNYPVLMWSFFFGLIVASTWLLIKHAKGIQFFKVVALILGTLLAYVLSVYSSFSLPSGNLGIFIAGGIAVSAMILPGLSGSLILILLGKYQTMLKAVENFNLPILFSFLAGVIFGLMAFSRLLKWLLANFYQTTIMFLAGLMLGSLVKVWPWKLAGVNVLPLNHPNPQLIFSLVLIAIAALMIFLFARIDKHGK